MAQPQPSPPSQPVPGPQPSPDPLYRWLVLSSVMIATFMAVLDATIVTVGLPKIIAAFGVPVDKGEWILTAYLLVFSVMLPSSGWLADYFGYKRFFIFGLFLFTLGSLASSLSWNIDALIVFRVVQGAGAGCIMPVGLAIITREFPPEKRGIALGFWSVSASASVALGPTLGGWLIQYYAWHAIFDINVPIGIVGMATSAVILREYRAPVVYRFDAAGFLGLSVFLTFLLLALANGNSSWNTGGWTSPYILTCFSLAAIGVVVFFVAETTVAHPLIELGLFRQFNFMTSNIVLLIFGFGMFGSTFLLPLFLQNLLDYTPLQAGLVFLPVGVILSISGPFAGFLTDRIGGKLPSILGLALMGISFLMYYGLSLYSERSQIMHPLYIRGIGMGFIFSPLTTVALAGISNQKMAQASGLINVIRQIGGSLGVAVFGTLLTQRTIFHSTNYGVQIGIHDDVARHAAVSMYPFIAHHSGGTLAQIGMKAQALLAQHAQNQAFAAAVDDVFLIAGISLIVSIIPAMLLKGVRKPTQGTGFQERIEHG